MKHIDHFNPIDIPRLLKPALLSLLAFGLSHWGSSLMQAKADDPDQTAQKILEKVRQAAFSLRSIDCTYADSTYPNERFRLRLSDGMIRVDFTFPTASATVAGHVVRGEHSQTFNGERFQNIHHESKTLVQSRIARSDERFGPSKLPLERWYDWLRAGETDQRVFKWSSIWDPATWAALPPPSVLPDRICSGEKCVGLTFMRKNNVSVNAYFAPQKGYLPMRSEVFSPDGKLAAVFQINGLHRIIDGRGAEVWFPDAMNYSQAPHESRPAQNITLEIMIKQLSVNHPIEKAEFTLTAPSGYHVIDWDILDAANSEETAKRAGLPVNTLPASVSNQP